MKIQPLSSLIGFWKDLIVKCSAGEVLNTTVIEQRGGSLAYYPSPYSSVSYALEIRQSNFPFWHSLFKVSHSCSCKVWINFSSFIFCQTQTWNVLGMSLATLFSLPFSFPSSVNLACFCIPDPQKGLHTRLLHVVAWGRGWRKGKHLWWVSYQRGHTYWSGRDPV